jgi:trans-aconitate 2-methyltransferase
MREWDAASYERVSEPQLAWGRAVLDRIALAGHETALDAGCGTGRVTRLLAERLPRGRVIAVDASAAMVAEARRRLADLGDRVEVQHADLLELQPAEPVDVVVSTATFHWILDHDLLFRRLRDVLRPGGRLVAQCGGGGNVAGILGAAAGVGRMPPYAPHLAGMPAAWTFPGPAATARTMAAAGFVDVRAWLEEAPALFDERASWEEFLMTVVLRCHMERLPRALRVPFTRAVAARNTDPDGRVRVDYVRLNMEGRRPAAGAAR